MKSVLVFKSEPSALSDLTVLVDDTLVYSITTRNGRMEVNFLGGKSSFEFFLIATDPIENPDQSIIDMFQ